MKYTDYQKAKDKIGQKFRELQGPVDRVREEENKLNGSLERHWKLSHRYVARFRGDFVIGYIEVEAFPGYKYASGDGVWSGDPRPGMLTLDELIALAKIKQTVGRWFSGEIVELPPSDVTL